MTAKEFGTKNGAFPCPENADDAGMSYRTYIATALLAGMNANPELVNRHGTLGLAPFAVSQADTLLEALFPPKPKPTR